MPPPRIVEAIVKRKRQKLQERLKQLLQFRILTLFVMTTVFACVIAIFVVFGDGISQWAEKKLQYLSLHFPVVPILDVFNAVSVPSVIGLGVFVFYYVFHRKTEKSFKRFCLIGLIGLVVFWIGAILSFYGISKPVGIGTMISAAFGRPLMFAGWFLPIAAFFAWFFAEPLKRRV